MLAIEGEPPYTSGNVVDSPPLTNSSCAVGGIAELPEVAGALPQSPDSSGGTTLSMTGLAVAATAGIAVLAACGLVREEASRPLGAATSFASAGPESS